MKRMLLLVTVALMLAAAMALSGVAQARPIADSADAKCAKLAIKTLGPSFNPSNYTFIGGTEGDDNFTGQATDGPYVFCGFGGDDFIHTLDQGDIFLGGADNDFVDFNFGGTFYGQEGNDLVVDNDGGSTFYGGAGNDFVGFNYGGPPEEVNTFYGGAGDDVVDINEGTFYGQEGNDSVNTNFGIFVQ
jgi:hypothetical protein